MKGKRVLKMMIVIAVFAAALLVFVLIIFPPSKGKMPQFYDEDGTMIQNSLAEKCYLEVEYGKLGMVLMAKDIRNPVLMVCGGGPGLPEYLMEYRYP